MTKFLYAYRGLGHNRPGLMDETGKIVDAFDDEQSFKNATGFTVETYAPAGKRTARRNVWGNVVGYVSGRRYKEFGDGYGPRGEFPADVVEWLEAGK
jgi:hypothetical protein